MKPVQSDEVVLFTEAKDGIFFVQTSNGEVFISNMEGMEKVDEAR